MSDQYLTIRLDNSKIDLAKSISLTYGRTNLPKHAFNFITHKPIFWKLECRHYDSTSGTLTVNVIDYNLPTDTILTEPEPKYLIKKLNFEKLDWIKFEPLIYSYTVAKLRDSIFNYRDSILYLKDGENKDVKSLKRTAPNLFFSKYEPISEEREIEIRIKYEEARFGLSKIVFSVHLKPYNDVRQLEISNPNLRPEFEYVKSYLVKRLGKSFQTKIRLKLLDNKIEEISATSDEISAIDEKLINSIKIASTLDLRHFASKPGDKILYNTNQLSAEAKELSLLTADAKEILEIFIENDEVKNVKQLDYLGRDRQSLNERLQFSIKPLFGFVFHELDNSECFIWELLNSHATYVWKNNSTDSLVDLSTIVEQAITAIRKNGREAYKKYYKTLESPSYEFRIIDHSSNNLTEEERFNDWKNKLDRVCS